jgi:hypothetical protein
MKQQRGWVYVNLVLSALCLVAPSRLPLEAGETWGATMKSR